jgi:hypothetical protein
MRLSDSQLRRYDEDGFVAIDRLIDDDKVAELRVAYGDVLNRRVEVLADQMLAGPRRRRRGERLHALPAEPSPGATP